MALNISILLISIWVAIVKRFSPGNLPLNYFLCSGLNPDQNHEEGYYLQAPKKYNTGRIILVLSFFLHLMMLPRIIYYQMVKEKNEQSIQLGTVTLGTSEYLPDRQGGRKKAVGSSSNNKTILDIVTHVIILGSFVAMGAVIMISDNVEPKQMNSEKYRWIPLYIQLYGPVISAIAILTVLFTMNCTILKKIAPKVFTVLPQ
jgi:CDP-diglyceride synthetase